MTVYLLHLSQPLSRGVSREGKPLQAGHYLGWTNDLVGRMLAHLDGHGARFTQVCVERGISFALVRTWDGEGRAFERKLKNGKNGPRLCPICKTAKAKEGSSHLGNEAGADVHDVAAALV